MDIQRFFNQGPRRVIDSEIHGESQECFEESRSPVVDHSAQAEANRATDVSTRHQGPANPIQPRSLKASEPGDLGLLCSLNTQHRARSVVECVVSAGCVISIQTKNVMKMSCLACSAQLCANIFCHRLN